MGTWDALVKDVLAEVAVPILGDGLMPTVQHYAWTGAFDSYGKPAVSPTATPRRAIVLDSDERVTIDRGGAIETVVAAYQVRFLSQIPVDTHDRLVLPGGREAPILRVDHGALADDGSRFVTVAICG